MIVVDVVVVIVVGQLDWSGERNCSVASVSVAQDIYCRTCGGALRARVLRVVTIGIFELTRVRESVAILEALLRYVMLASGERE
jgi:hypothetical protein